MEKEQGYWFNTSDFVWGIKVSKEKCKELFEEVQKYGGWRKDEDSKLFWLHEDWSTLSGFWIGNWDYNPDGLVIGTELWDENGDFINSELIDVDKIQEGIEQIQKCWDCGQLTAIEEFLGEENLTPQLYLVTARYWLTRKEIENDLINGYYMQRQPLYQNIVDNNLWETREV